MITALLLLNNKPNELNGKEANVENKLYIAVVYVLCSKEKTIIPLLFCKLVLLGSHKTVIICCMNLLY